MHGSALNISGSAFLWRCKIEVSGSGNLIEIHDRAVLRNCSIYVSGNNNVIRIGADAHVFCGEFWVEDDTNKIEIGPHSNLCGKVYLACIEGTSLSIGKDCLLSSEIVLRTGDPHSLINLDTGLRINHSSDIVIGDHVWIGHRVLATKGVSIAEGCAIGTGSVVTKSIDEHNIVLAGVPATVVKRNVSWDARRL